MRLNQIKSICGVIILCSSIIINNRIFCESYSKDYLNYKPKILSTNQALTFVKYKDNAEKEKMIGNKTKSKSNKDIQYKKDLYYLTAVIYQEVGGEDSDLLQQMVANIVINRVSHSDFADTIYNVLTSKHQYGMMWKYGVHLPKITNKIELKAIEKCKQNAKIVLEGKRVCPTNVVYQSEFKNLGDGTFKKFKTKYGTMYFNYKK